MIGGPYYGDCPKTRAISSGYKIFGDFPKSKNVRVRYRWLTRSRWYRSLECFHICTWRWTSRRRRGGWARTPSSRTDPSKLLPLRLPRSTTDVTPGRLLEPRTCTVHTKPAMSPVSSNVKFMDDHLVRFFRRLLRNNCRNKLLWILKTWNLFS